MIVLSGMPARSFIAEPWIADQFNIGQRDRCKHIAAQSQVTTSVIAHGNSAEWRSLSAHTTSPRAPVRHRRDDLRAPIRHGKNVRAITLKIGSVPPTTCIRARQQCVAGYRRAVAQSRLGTARAIRRHPANVPGDAAKGSLEQTRQNQACFTPNTRYIPPTLTSRLRRHAKCFGSMECNLRIVSAFD